MKVYLKTLSYIIFVLTLNSCGSSKSIGANSEINKELNSQYRNSKKKISGKLNPTEYAELKTQLQKELGVEIAENKNILINFDQKAPNCILLSSSKSVISTVLNNRVRISSEMSKKYNTIDYFVYTSNSYFADLLTSDSFFKLDSGFFYNNIFTVHENCQAFYILKTNGAFLKYYGEDYYSEVKEFLEKSYEE